MRIDEDSCYRAVSSRDLRFDGWFFVGVATTGIFCRPSCPATTPKRANVRFFPTAAAAQGAGFRACRRCRPDTAPGSPEWNVRGDLAGRAMALINDGAIDRDGVSGVASRLAVSERHLHRLLVQELGASPVALARSRRAHTARVLIETTDLPFTEVAFAAGFASIRQFNDTVREFFGASPTTLRADRSASIRRGRAGSTDAQATATTISLRLATRTPFAGTDLLAFLARRSIPGLEVADGDAYQRVLSLPHGVATVAFDAAPDHIQANLALTDLRDLGPAVARCRRLLDLDADPAAIDAALGADPHLGPLVAAVPGRRSPGTVDGLELLTRAIVGQQISVAGAGTVLGRIVASLGEPVPPSLPLSDGQPVQGIAFPTAEALAHADPATFSMPRARAATIQAAARAMADGSLVLDPGMDRGEAEASLLALKGIGPWTAAYTAMRGLNDPDAFLPTDVGVLHGLRAVGAAGDPKRALAVADAWRPWRSYAVHHLWAAAS